MRSLSWSSPLRFIRRVTISNEYWWFFAVVVILVVGSFLSWHFWEQLRGTVESDSIIIRNITLVIAAPVALILTIWRSTVAGRQATTSEHSLLNERYQKGAEMLGNEVLSVRLAGIYALDRLARDYPEQYHLEIMKLFCAFARNPTSDENLVLIEIIESIEADPQEMPAPDMLQIYRSRRAREDVQAVLTAIGKRSEKSRSFENAKGFELDLCTADLRNVVLTDANLSGSNVLLIGALLSNALIFNTNLSNADMRGAILEDAIVSGACLWGTQLSGANLSGTKFYWTGLDPTKGLSQGRLNEARSDPSNPPSLKGVRDVITGDLLEWRGKSLSG